MVEFPELHRAYPRPTDAEANAALLRVTSRAQLGPVPWRTALRIAAVVTGLVGAYGAGFTTGRHSPDTATREVRSPVRPGRFVARPPVLVVGPRSQRRS
jgi:hypothetical protein